MSDPRAYLFLCCHIHSHGDEVYLVSSDSPHLDEVDLAVHDPDCYELQKETETVVLEPAPSVLDGIVEAADASERAILLDTMLSVPKASAAQRQAYLDNLDDGERELVCSRYAV